MRQAWGGEIPIDLLNPSSVAAWRTLLESIFYDKKIVTDDVARQLFTNRLRNNDGYTIERTLAGFARPQFEDDKLKSIHAPVVWGRNDALISVDDAEKFGSGIPGVQVKLYEHEGELYVLAKSAGKGKRKPFGASRWRGCCANCAACDAACPNVISCYCASARRRKKPVELLASSPCACRKRTKRLPARRSLLPSTNRNSIRRNNVTATICCARI